jgi:type IV secretion system protein VirB5
MKLLITLTIVIIPLFFTVTSYAQLAVMDVALLTSQQSYNAESIAQALEQLAQLQSQLTQMEREYESLTGTRNLGTILNNPQLRNYLPENWQTVYDDVRRGGYSGLSDSAKSIYNQNTLYDSCQFHTQVEEKKVCEARAVKAAQDKAFSVEAFEKSKQRLTQIENLMQEINTTRDPKAIAELQARLSAEQSAITNEQTKLQLFQMSSQIEDQLQQQRNHEIAMREAAKTGTLNIQPMSFQLGR